MNFIVTSDVTVTYTNTDELGSIEHMVDLVEAIDGNEAAFLVMNKYADMDTSNKRHTVKIKHIGKQISRGE
jgi:hypothetical protein